MKSLKVTVVSEVTELQEMTVKVPNEFPSWSQDEQESFLGAKVKESFQEHHDNGPDEDACLCVHSLLLPH